MTDQDQTGTDNRRQITAATVARRGAQRIGELVEPSGRFIYAYDPRTGAPVAGYNLLRHCGSVWSMLVVARHEGGMPGEVAKAEKAMAWVLSGQTRQVGDALCITSGHTAKLGGCGLGLLALTELYRATGAERWLDPARALGRFVLRCRRDDGDFHHKVDVETMLPTAFRSDYYTGEALFGLLRLYQTTGEAQWLDAARRSIVALEAQDYGVAQKSHWMIYTIAELHACEPADRWLTYAGRIAWRLIDEAANPPSYRTSPLATRVEALMAYAAMPGAGTMANDALGPPRLQALTVCRDYLAALMRNRLPDGGFVSGPKDQIVQIDNIQHAAHAFFAYNKYLRSEQGQM